MAKKFTRKAVEGMVEEFLDLVPKLERYKYLEGQIKAGLPALKLAEVAIEGKGRVFIGIGERVTVPPELVRATLAPELADKIVETKETVSNDIIKALVTLGEISPEQREQLLAGAQRTPVTSFYVRPLK